MHDFRKSAERKKKKKKVIVDRVSKRMFVFQFSFKFCGDLKADTDVARLFGKPTIEWLKKSRFPKSSRGGRIRGTTHRRSAFPRLIFSWSVKERMRAYNERKWFHRIPTSLFPDRSLSQISWNYIGNERFNYRMLLAHCDGWPREWLHPRSVTTGTRNTYNTCTIKYKIDSRKNLLRWLRYFVSQRSVQLQNARPFTDTHGTHGRVAARNRRNVLFSRFCVILNRGWLGCVSASILADALSTMQRTLEFLSKISPVVSIPSWRR